RTIRIPSSAGQQLAAISRAEEALRRRGSTSNKALAERTGMSVRTVSELRGAAHVTASLDEVVSEHGSPLGELIADRDATDAQDRAGERESREQVRRMLRALPPKHRQLVTRRFGLDGREPDSHADIAASLGVGEERSRQLEREALHWLRELGGGRE